jgi:hypothetical protein
MINSDFELTHKNQIDKNDKNNQTEETDFTTNKKIKKHFLRNKKSIQLITTQISSDDLSPTQSISYIETKERCQNREPYQNENQDQELFTAESKIDSPSKLNDDLYLKCFGHTNEHVMNTTNMSDDVKLERIDEVLTFYKNERDELERIKLNKFLINYLKKRYEKFPALIKFIEGIGVSIYSRDTFPFQSMYPDESYNHTKNTLTRFKISINICNVRTNCKDPECEHLWIIEKGDIYHNGIAKPPYVHLHKSPSYCIVKNKTLSDPETENVKVERERLGGCEYGQIYVYSDVVNKISQRIGFKETEITSKQKVFFKIIEKKQNVFKDMLLALFRCTFNFFDKIRLRPELFKDDSEYIKQ